MKLFAFSILERAVFKEPHHFVFLTVHSVENSQNLGLKTCHNQLRLYSNFYFPLYRYEIYKKSIAIVKKIGINIFIAS